MSYVLRVERVALFFAGQSGVPQWSVFAENAIRYRDQWHAIDDAKRESLYSQPPLVIELVDHGTDIVVRRIKLGRVIE